MCAQKLFVAHAIDGQVFDRWNDMRNDRTVVDRDRDQIETRSLAFGVFVVFRQGKTLSRKPLIFVSCIWYFGQKALMANRFCTFHLHSMLRVRIACLCHSTIHHLSDILFSIVFFFFVYYCFVCSVASNDSCAVRQQNRMTHLRGPPKSNSIYMPHIL